MGIKPRFSPADIDKYLNEKKARLLKMVIDRLVYIGERFVANARNNGNYMDRTGNLRSSIGYIVLYNGSVIKQNFKTSNKGSDRKRGLSKAMDFAESIAEDYPRGFVLIVVAGMDYAAVVESKGKDVLTGSSITAKQELMVAMQQIKKSLKRS